MMTDQLDPLTAGPLQNIDPASILRLFVDIDGYKTVQRMAEIMRNTHGLDEDFRENHGATQIKPDASLHGADHRAQATEVDHRGFPKGRAGDMRMHVHDVRPKSDVNGA